MLRALTHPQPECALGRAAKAATVWGKDGADAFFGAYIETEARES